MNTVLLVAGWKSVSLVDVHGYSSFTLWLCGCNLKCPFCHNWRIANNDSSLCKPMSVDSIVEEVYASRILVDFLHVTGGEPLLQHGGLAYLFQRTRDLGIRNSLNSNLTLSNALRALLERDLVDHVATDLKIPPQELYGVPAAPHLWAEFLESLKTIKEHGVTLELRIPVYKKLTPALLGKYLEEIVDLVSTSNTVVILNQLLGEPFVTPRDPSWCKENCNVDPGLLEDLANALKSRGFSRVIIKSIPGFQR